MYPDAPFVGEGGTPAPPDTLRAVIRRRRLNENPSLPEGISDADLSQHLLRKFDQEERGAWLNEGQRTDARKAYLDQLPPDADAGQVRSRAAESRYLLDPITRKALPTYGDAKFLEKYDRVHGQKPYTGNPWGGGTPDPYSEALAKSALEDAAASYQQDISGPLAHPDDRTMLHRAIDPESNLGYGLARMGVTPSAYRLKFGGEAPQSQSSGAGPVLDYLRMRMGLLGNLLPSADAFGAAAGNVQAQENYRPFTATPVLGVEDTSSITGPPAVQGHQIRALLHNLRADQALAEPPMATERWMRTTGWKPPAAVAFVSDLLVDFMDLTALADYAVPAMRGIKTLGRMMRSPSLMGAARAARSAGIEIAPDAAVELGAAAALHAPEQPYESGSFVKSDEELARAQEVRARNELERLPEDRERFYDNARRKAREPQRLLQGLTFGP